MADMQIRMVKSEGGCCWNLIGKGVYTVDMVISASGE